METHSEKHQLIRTLLSFALIPLSGFATDIYIPSLPSMAAELNVSNAVVQLSLVYFLISYGISQLFVGSLLDSFGRYRLGLGALLLFAAASLGIAVSHNIYVIDFMRVVQGFTVALIVVGKRAYFVDTFTGDKLKNYTSLFSIIWATAPIVAPFLGGYLQTYFGWESNFYFLGILTLVIALLEVIYGRESLKVYQQFNFNSIANVYYKMLRTTDFSLGLIILGLSYCMLIVYGMASPFIVEHVYHYSSVVTGYCALISGVSLMIGGIVSKSLIHYPFFKKIFIAASVQLFFAIGMIATALYSSNIYTLMAFVVVIHFASGFVFNSYFSYCLGRFTSNAGIASGIIGGGVYVITSILSYSIINIVDLKSQVLLGFGYLTLASFLFIVLFFVRREMKLRPVLS